MERSKRAKEGLLAQQLRVQCGAAATRQIEAIGFDRHWIYRKVRRGTFAWILPGVIVSTAASPCWEQDLVAAILWAGDESVASFRAAARLWEIDGFGSAPVEITTTNLKNAEGLRTLAGRRAIVHRSDRHLVGEMASVGGIPVTSPRKTVLDLAGCRHAKAEWALDHFIRRRLTDVGQVWLLLEQEWIRGRRGIAILRDLLIPRTKGRAPADSDLEIEMRGLLDSGGFPPPVHQHPVSLPDRDVRLDLCYPDIKLVIEVDSYAWHMDREALDRDRDRDNELRRLGWTVLRFTWAMLRFETDKVMGVIRDIYDELRRSQVR